MDPIFPRFSSCPSRQVLQVRKRDTSRIYALKTIRKAHIVNRNEITHTLAERLVLAQVDSPFIVPLKFSFQSEQKLYLVLALVFRLLVSWNHELTSSSVSPDLSMEENFSITCNGSTASMRNVHGMIRFTLTNLVVSHRIIPVSTALSFCLRLSTFMSSTLFIGMFVSYSSTAAAHSLLVI